MTDLHQLAAVLLGLDPDLVDDDDWDEVEMQFADKYNIGILDIEELLDDLLLLVVPQVHPLGGVYQFFGQEDPVNPGVWTAILRREYKGLSLKTG